MQRFPYDPMATLLLACLGFLATSPTMAATYTVGAGASCTHPTIAAAIASAAAQPGADTIRIARNATYTMQALVIDNHDVTLQGGYSSCALPIPDGTKTVINGSGGSTTSVITIVGIANVTLASLEITGGDETVASFGGGIDFSANGLLTLRDLLVVDNEAGFGAGINIDGRGRNSVVLIEDDVTFSLNSAVQDGGGVYCREATIVAIGDRIQAMFNTAGSEGGGWYLSSCDATLGAGGNGSVGIAYANSAAFHGGGFHIRGDSDVRLYTHADSAAIRVSANSAGGDGGGIAVYGTARVRAWELDLVDNRAERGGAVFATSNAWFAMSRGIDAADAPIGAQACRRGLSCNRIIDNLAEDAEGQPGDGAAVSLVSDADSSTRVHVEDAVIARNDGRTVLHGVAASSSTGSELALRQCLVHHNDSTHALIYMRQLAPRAFDDAIVPLTYLTIADNDIGGERVIDAVSSAGATSLAYSIVMQPGTRVGSAWDFLATAYLIVHDDVDFDVLNDETILESTDPGFVDRPNADYSLRVDALAVDFAPDSATALPSYDIQRAPRAIDVPTNGNGPGGEIDLGPYEYQHCQRADTIYCHGFE